MSRTKVFFDGFELTRRFAVSNLKEGLLPRTIKTVEVPGRDGSLFTGVTLTEKTIGMTLTTLAKTVEERQAAARMLAAILAVDEPKPLLLSIDNGLYRMAIPSTDIEAARYRNATAFEVSFVVPDPVMYGVEKVITVPSGGSVTFEVGGTYPTRPVVSASAAANGGNGFWRVRLEDGSYLLATIPDGVSTAPVIADCEARTLMVNSSVALLVPSADWLKFSPGQHTLEMTGTGAATVTFTERWL